MHAENRRRFMERMEGGAAVFFAAPERTRSNDTEYRFRQDSDFRYLTGFPEPEAAAVLRPGHPEAPYVLFVRPRDREREIWNGRRFGPEGAKERFGADATYTIDKLPEMLPSLLENADNLYYRMGRYPERDPMILTAIEAVRKKLRLGVRAPSAIVDPGAILHEMRVLKTAKEMEVLRRAASISAEAHREAMRMTRPGLREYEVEAVVEYVFRRRGAEAPGYTTIVGSGVNATILHYVENNGTCADGELLLIDAGAEVDGYTADITRTFPVSGRFTPDQRRVYDVVLAAQLAAIDKARPGNRFDDVHDAAVRALVEGLVKLGVLSGETDALIAAEAYKPYYMHRTSHWLGLDVHDVGWYCDGDGSRRLEPGMVLTVEPGLYFPEDLTDVPAALRGIGIRIEDDVLVTPSGFEVITAEVPKTAADIEALMETGKSAPAWIAS